MKTSDRALRRVDEVPVSPALAADPGRRQRLRESLSASGIFDNLSWSDAMLVADAVTADVNRPNGAGAMRRRALTVAVGRETWDDRNAAVFALTLAADVLDAFEEARGAADECSVATGCLGLPSSASLRAT